MNGREANAVLKKKRAAVNAAARVFFFQVFSPK
jgi:hypothetical protein